MTRGVISRITVGVPSRMTAGVLSGMTAVVIPAKAGIQELFLSSNIREKNNIDSCLKISGITENENEKEVNTGSPIKLGMTSYWILDKGFQG